MYMELNDFFKAIIDADRTSVVICNLEHTIVYMNPAACSNYEKRGGSGLVGKSLLACHNEESVKAIERVLEWFKKDREHNLVYTFHNEKQNKDVYMVALRNSDGELIGYYEKHEFRTGESMKRYDLY